MTPPTVNALVMWSTAFPHTVAFYRAIGLPLADEQHDDGPVHAACELGPMHVAVYAAAGDAALPGHREAGGTLVGFVVADLDAVLAALPAIAGVAIVRAPEDMPWGRRAVVRDPDGRVVELTQTRRPAPDAAPGAPHPTPRTRRPAPDAAPDAPHATPRTRRPARDAPHATPRTRRPAPDAPHATPRTRRPHPAPANPRAAALT